VEKERTKPKATKPKIVHDQLSDAYKFISWGMRKLARQLGYEFGNAEFDANLAGAASSFMPATELAKRDEMYALALHACAGAYKGVKK